MSAIRRTVGAALVPLLVLAGAARAPAQEIEVGRFDRLAELLGRGQVRTIREATPQVQMRLSGATEWMDVGPESQLHHGSGLRVERFVDVRLRVRRPAQRGVLVFLPELWEKRTGRVFPAGEVGGTVAEGLYAVSVGAGGGEELTVTLQQGSLVVDWEHGRLVVTAAGTRTLVQGTELSVVADPGGQTGAVFLRSGEVAFPDFPQVQVRPGEWALLQAGAAPVVAALGAAQLALAREVTRFHAHPVFRSGLENALRSPLGIAASTAVVLAAGYIVMEVFDDDDPYERRGTVTARFP